MKYITIEIQTAANGTVSTVVNQDDTRPAAESRYHTILAAAAVSVLPVHAAILMTNDGFVLMSESYEHQVQQGE